MRTDFIDKAIGETGEVSTGPVSRLRGAALAGVALTCAFALAALTLSYVRNGEAIRKAEEAAAAYRERTPPVSEIVGDHDLGKILGELQALRALPSGYADRASAEASGGSLGLNQTERLKSAAETAYKIGLERLLRPRLAYWLEQKLEAGETDAARILSAFKVYLMLGGLTAVDRPLLIDWMARDWSQSLSPGAGADETRSQLEQHLLAMIDLESAQGSFVRLNGPLVEKTQAALARLDVAERACRRLADAAKTGLRDDWTAIKAGGADARLIFTDTLDAVRVPYFFTRSGFEHVFVAKLPSVLDEMAQDRVILGQAGEDPAVAAQYDRLTQNIVDLYARRFVGAWRDALDKLRLRPLTAQRPTYPLMAAAASADSPIVRILESIRDETFLGEGEAVGEGEPRTSESGEGVVFSAGEPAARRIDAGLAAFHYAVAGGGGRRPIDVLTSRLSRIRDDLSRFANASAPDERLRAGIAAETARLRTGAAPLPPPFAQMFETAAARVEKELAGLAASKPSKARVPRTP